MSSGVGVPSEFTVHALREIDLLNHLELELELIQTQMTQKPMLRAKVHAHALRASQNRKEEVCWGRRV